HGVRFGLDRIRIRILHPADHLDGARLHLERLALRGRGYDRSGRLQGAAGGELLDLVGVIRERVRGDHLQRVERRTIGEVHERDACLGVPPGAHPALDGDRSVLRGLPGQDLAHVEFSFVHDSRVTQAERHCPVTRGAGGRRAQSAKACWPAHRRGHAPLRLLVIEERTRALPETGESVMNITMKTLSALAIATAALAMTVLPGSALPNDRLGDPNITTVFGQPKQPSQPPKLSPVLTKFGNPNTLKVLGTLNQPSGPYHCLVCGLPHPQPGGT